jgi:hypothetical protein
MVSSVAKINLRSFLSENKNQLNQRHQEQRSMKKIKVKQKNSTSAILYRKIFLDALYILQLIKEFEFNVKYSFD